MAGVHTVMEVKEVETPGWGKRYHAIRSGELLAHFPTYGEADAYLGGMIRALSEVEDAIRKVA